jgi:manganese/zinc/iron transport system substrate-binding protein
MKVRYLILLGMVGLLLLTAACGDATAGGEPEDGRLRIVTTTGMVGDVVANVGGDHVLVTSLMGAGTDPHLYVASARDVDKLQDADAIFYNGLFLEAQMEDILEQIAENKVSVPIGGRLDKSRLLPSADYADEFDPHIWFDVSLWAETIHVVSDTLQEMDPQNAADYEANAAAYAEELERLHHYVLEQAARVPEEKRVLITAHDAFNYFGRAYGFDVQGLQGISTQAEASTADVQSLARLIAENEIPAIFIESSVPVRNVEAVQAAVANQGFNVAIGGQLFSDAMGDSGTPEGTYVGMVRHNIDTIVGALLNG